MGYPIFTGLLVIGALSAESGLLVLNRVVLAAGVNKFPYPVTTSLIQCLITSFLVVGADRLLRTVLPFFIPKEPVLPPDVDQEVLYLKDDNTRPSYADLLRSSSPQHISSWKTGLNRSSWEVTWKVLPIAIVYLTKLGLGNVFLARLPLPTYVLLRVAAIPLSIVSNAVFWGDPYSVLALSSAFFAISSLVLATIPFAEHIAMGHLFLGLPLSIADALFPFLITKMYHDLCQKIISQRESPVRHEDHHLATVVVLRTQLGSRSFWSAMRQLPLLSTALLVPIVFMSGELRSIQQNCYVLDVSTLWHLLTASGVLNGVVLIFIWLLAIATSPVTTTFLVAAIIAFLLAVITYSRFTVYGWVDLVICWLLSLCFILLQMKEGAISATATTRSIYTVLRNLTVLAVLSACIYNITRLSQETFSFRTVEVSSVATCEPAAYSSPNTSSLNSTEIAEMISATKDNYLGARPHVDTMANLSLIVERCSDAPSGRGVDDVVRCLSYLSNAQLGYFSLPDSSAGTRASDEQSQDSGNVDAFSRYVTLSSAIAASATSIGKCTGPVLPYHVYWTGPASWRVELFIKAYLYTQNLPCSRLWLWLESDLDPNAVNKMLCEDPVFSKFRPLVDRGDIVLKPWNFPLRLPLVKEKTSISNALEAHSGSANETVLPDATVEDATGQQWLVLNPTHTAFSPVQVSDAVRFIVLHLHGGVYLDMDVLILRDMRPLLLPDPTSGHQHAFAEQWVERCNPGEYNTAVISLPANSSLSSYLLRGGVRMGMNFHPKVIGRMMWRDGRNDELKMLHNAVFDPLVTNLRRQGTTTCTVPCHKNFKSAFMSTVEEAPNEWSNYRGETFAAIGDSHNTDIAEALPSTNRTLENFFRGSFAYHIHNQWRKFPEPSSWMDVITRAQDGFFSGPRTNVYGETWAGPAVERYDRDLWL